MSYDSIPQETDVIWIYGAGAHFNRVSELIMSPSIKQSLYGAVFKSTNYKEPKIILISLYIFW